MNVADLKRQILTTASLSQQEKMEALAGLRPLPDTQLATASLAALVGGVAGNVIARMTGGSVLGGSVLGGVAGYVVNNLMNNNRGPARYF